MRARSLLFMIVFVLGTMTGAAPGNAGEPGSAGLLSLRLGMGARAGAMGETGVASSFDATAVFWNPASLVLAPGTQVALQHTEYFGLFRQEMLTASHQTDYGAFGLLFSGFYSDELERTSLEPSGVAQGKFRPYDVAFGLAYALRVSQVTLGITGKLVYERIDAYSDWVSAFDFGISHEAVIPGLVMAATVQNIGPKMKLDQQEFDLPRTLRLGASYRPILDGAPGLRRLQAVGEVVVPNDGNSRLHLGLEGRLHESFALRLGHRFSYDTWGPTFGAGFHRGPLDVDYAYMHNENDFDPTHRFSLNLAY